MIKFRSVFNFGWQGMPTPKKENAARKQVPLKAKALTKEEHWDLAFDAIKHAKANAPAGSSGHACFRSGLVALNPAINKELAGLKSVNEISDELIGEIWKDLNIKTDVCENKHIISYAAREEDYDPSMEYSQGQHVKLRFPDIFPAERTAMPDPFNVGENRYGMKYILNANEVNFEGGQNFIASQCPLEGEIPGFLRMLSEKEVPLIIDLVSSTDYDEKLRGEARYSPSNARQANYQGIAVQCRQREQANGVENAVIEHLKIKDGDGSHHLQRLHFYGWPDHGVVGVDTLRRLRRQAEALQPEASMPILVHCRAGVGRTGTLMSFMEAWRRIERVLKSGQACTPQLMIKVLLDVVAQGRTDRGGSFVQTGEQFALIAKSLIVEAKEFKRSMQHQKNRLNERTNAMRQIESRNGNPQPSILHAVADHIDADKRGGKQVGFNSKKEVRGFYTNELLTGGKVPLNQPLNDMKFRPRRLPEQKVVQRVSGHTAELALVQPSAVASFDFNASLEGWVQRKPLTMADENKRSSNTSLQTRSLSLDLPRKGQLVGDSQNEYLMRRGVSMDDAYLRQEDDFQSENGRLGDVKKKKKDTSFQRLLKKLIPIRTSNKNPLPVLHTIKTSVDAPLQLEQKKIISDSSSTKSDSDLIDAIIKEYDVVNIDVIEPTEPAFERTPRLHEVDQTNVAKLSQQAQKKTLEESALH